MAKGKGTKPRPAAKKPTAKKPAAKPAAKKPAVKKPAAKKPAAKPAAKPVAKPVVKKAPVEAAPLPAPAAEAGAGLVKKKKVKRGAPPMLPRRLARRVPPPLPPGSTPPPLKATQPGSLHAPARVPEGAEALKARLMAVVNDLQRLKAMKRTIQKNFWEAGLLLNHLSDPTLYGAKGYGSWESFVEREVEREIGIGRMVAEDLRRIVRIFQRENAEELGMERLRAGLKALFPEPGAAPSTPPMAMPGA